MTSTRQSRERRQLRLPPASIPLAVRSVAGVRPRAGLCRLDKPLEDATIALLTSAGIYVLGEQEGFDVERERNDPMWGDPTLRTIRSDVTQSEIGATHLHIRTDDLLADVDIALPINRLAEFVAEGWVGAAASEHFSVMGYQSEGAEVWRTETGPEIAARCHAAGSMR